MLTTESIIRDFKEKIGLKQPTILRNVFFKVTKNYIVSEPNIEYQEAEVNWFLSGSRNISKLEEFYGKVPKIWEMIADEFGNVNSNYGYNLIYRDNNQIEEAIEHLKLDPNTRRAVLIPAFQDTSVAFKGRTMYQTKYMTREIYNETPSDMVCNVYDNIYIENNKLHFVAHMRSQDARFGYNNDIYWFRTLQEMIYNALLDTYPSLQIGDLYEFVDNLHIYERDVNIFLKNNK